MYDFEMNHNTTKLSANTPFCFFDVFAL